jgi:hypothetical protein
MSKKHKILLPFALYEELENIDQLDPVEMKAFLLSLRRYCDSTGKDFNKVCKELELAEPEWSGKLTPRQIEALDQAMKDPYYSNRSGSWSINPETGLVDTEGNFQGGRSSLIKNSGSLMGIKFGKAEGDFNIRACGLTTLEGCPSEVTGVFDASSNKFEDLKGSPRKVGSSFYASSNSSLKSLDGGPEEVVGDFNAVDAKMLDSLKGIPEKIGGSIRIDSTSVRDLKGCPKEIGSKASSTTLSASDCVNLVSLEGAPVLLNTRGNPDSNFGKDYNFTGCSNLYTLEGLPLEENYSISLDRNGLKPNVLRRALNSAKSTKSWVVAYLTMFTDPDFIKTGKAPKDPIREKLSPANIKKEIEENGERFVVGLKSIWNDFRVKKILKEIEVPENTKADAEMLSALDDIGL